MWKAFAIKLLALAVTVAAALALPTPWAIIVGVAIWLAVAAFFTYTIAHPASRFFIDVVDRLPATAPHVALTFDDGPDPDVTPRVLDVLRAHGAKATFFVLGERAARFPDVVRRIREEGHAIGTHTQHHALRFHFGSAAYVSREIEDAIAAVSAITNARPQLFRPPQGLRTPPFTSGWRQTRGLTCVTWTVRGLDSRPTTADRIVARIEPALAPGAIITLHDGTGLGGGIDREPTVAALERILATCDARGLRCVTVEEGLRA